ncbi:MAG: hypothetical protein SFZ23_05255 [Planctomycetota bacterium]|nr:hypothetical protein [Planctomycetota bacterium]
MNTMLPVVALSFAGTCSFAQSIMMYDNWTPPLPGRTVLNSVLRVGRDEIGDDLNLTNYQDGFIDGMGWTIANLSTTNQITSYRERLTWIDRDTSQILGSVTYGGEPLREPIPPGARFRVDIPSSSVRVPVRPRMYFTIQYFDVVGASVDDIGLLYGGPTTVGSSSRFIRNFTTGQDIDLGGSNQNLGFYIRVRPIPAPGVCAAGLFAFGALATRRRRSP